MPVPVDDGSVLGWDSIDRVLNGTWLDCQAGRRSGTEGDEASDDAGGETHGVGCGWRNQALPVGCVDGVGSGMDDGWMSWVEELMVELLGWL